MKNTILVCVAWSCFGALHAQTIPTPPQTDQIILDNNSNGKADPGDSIRYKVTIQNTGAGNATGVKLNAIPDPRTTLNPASFRTSPLAMPDGPYSCIGNVGITVPDGINDLLANDYDDNPGGLTITAGTFATTQGGSITIAANGSFSYNPPRGYEGTDSYQYTLNDGNAVAGVTTTDVAIVTFTVSGMIWFINNNAGACAATCDGRMSNPYTSLTDFNTANAMAGGLNPDNNENIFIYESSTAYTGGIVLRSGQKLFGQDATITLAAMTALTPPTHSNALPVTNSANGAKATITNTTVNGNGITLSTNNTLRGFTVGNTATTGTGAGINGNGMGALTINEVSKNGTGQILSLNNGSVNASFIELSTTNTNQTAVVLSNLTAGSVTDVDGSGSSISGANGVFSITSGTTTNVALTFNGDVTHAGANPLLLVQNHGTGTVTFQNGTLSSTGGGINFTNSDGTYNFNGTTTLSGASRITIDGGSSGMFNFNSNTSVTNPTNIAFDLNGSNATVDYNGTLSSNTAFRLIDIASNTGGSASFDGNLTFTGNAIGIRVQQNTGGTYSFNGASKTITSGANNAVSLVTNPGAFINFTGGGLVLTTTSGTGFNATGGGTVTVQGTGNTINSASATALNVANTTIGVSGLTFQSISSGNNTAAADPVNGIVLNTTGSSGGLMVTGDGGGSNNNSGGTIQNTTGAGVSLISTSSLSLNYMNIQNSGDDGIGGTSVTGLTMHRSNVTNNGNALNEDGVDFGGSGVITPNGLYGTVSVTNSVFTGNYYNQFTIRNSNNSVNSTFTGCTFTGRTAENNNNDGLFFEALGTSTITGNVQNCTFSANKGDHFQSAATNSGDLNITFKNNTLTGGHSFALGQGITINAALGALFGGYSGNVVYDVDGNNINGAIVNSIHVIQGTSSSTATFTGFIRNNIIGISGTALSGSTQANGIAVEARGNGTHTSSVTGNTIRQCYDRGILTECGDGSATFNLTVQSNIIDQQVGADAREAIQTNFGITDPNVFGVQDAPTICLQLGGAGALANTFSHGGGAPDDFRLRKRFGTTVRLPGYAGGTGQDMASLDAVVAFIRGQNTGSAGEPGSATASGSGGGYTGGAACNLP